MFSSSSAVSRCAQKFLLHLSQCSGGFGLIVTFCPLPLYCLPSFDLSLRMYHFEPSEFCPLPIMLRTSSIL